MDDYDDTQLLDDITGPDYDLESYARLAKKREQERLDLDKFFFPEDWG